MDNCRSLLSINRMDRVPNARIRELCRVPKSLDERIDKGGSNMLIGWRMIGLLRESIGVCCSRSVGRPRKRWIDTVKNCLRTIGLDMSQALRMMKDRSDWGVCEEMNP